jgi:Zn-dependent M28 family amino/carboxypeptidase
MRLFAFLAAGLACATLAPAQTSPFVDEKTERALVNELSGDLAFEHMRLTTQWHKPSGSEGFFAVARYALEKAKEAGLEDVRWIDQVNDSASWTCRRAEAWLLDGPGSAASETKLGSYSEVATSIADYSRSADVTAELVDVGAGERASDYEGRDVRGKVVLSHGSLALVTEQAVWKRGAAGILSWSSTRLNPLADAPDQIAWQRVPERDGPNGEKTTFAFILSAREGKALSDRLRKKEIGRASGEGGESVPLRARIVVESGTLAGKRSAMVEARIRGTDPSLPEVVLTSHLQEEKFSANDNQSGVVNMLEIGRALTRLIAEGKLARPRRGIRFWWCDEIRSEYRYFADHPGEAKKILANLNQDMVGARQSVGGRVQHLTRMPWSQPSYLADVEESILDMVVAGNNAYLPAGQAGSLPPGVSFSKPIFAHLGTREPFHARAVPYFDSTDHLVFVDSWIRVPGTTLTNWPDENIHSSADDLWQMDATQLKRNAFIVAATALWLSNAGGPEVARLAPFVTGRALERIARDVATAVEWMRSGKGTEMERSRAARNLVDASIEKEDATIASMLSLGPTDAMVASVLDSRRNELRKAARMIRDSIVPSLVLDGSVWNAGPLETERRLEKRVPKKAAGTLADWLLMERNVADKRAAEARARREERDRGAAPVSRPGKGKASARSAPARDLEEKKLTALMQFEALNWVDGTTDAATIARRVCAEALSAGAWYYGECTPEMVEKFFESEVKDGLITMATRAP